MAEVSRAYERKEMPAPDCDERSLMIWGILTTEEPATVAIPRALETASFRHCVDVRSMSRMRF